MVAINPQFGIEREHTDSDRTGLAAPRLDNRIESMVGSVADLIAELQALQWPVRPGENATNAEKERYRMLLQSVKSQYIGLRKEVDNAFQRLDSVRNKAENRQAPNQSEQVNRIDRAKQTLRRAVSETMRSNISASHLMRLPREFTGPAAPPARGIPNTSIEPGAARPSDGLVVGGGGTPGPSYANGSGPPAEWDDHADGPWNGGDNWYANGTGRPKGVVGREAWAEHYGHEAPGPRRADTEFVSTYNPISGNYDLGYVNNPNYSQIVVPGKGNFWVPKDKAGEFRANGYTHLDGHTVVKVSRGNYQGTVLRPNDLGTANESPAS